MGALGLRKVKLEGMRPGFSLIQACGSGHPVKPLPDPLLYVRV